MGFPFIRNFGKTIPTAPEVCRTPAPSPPIPTPYPNIGSQGSALGSSKKVKITKKLMLKKHSILSKSAGNEAGTTRGMASGKIMNPASFPGGVTKIKMQGMPLVLMGRLVDYKHGRTLPLELGLICQASDCNQGAKAYLPSSGKPVCLQHYKSETSSLPLPGSQIVVLP